MPEEANWHIADLFCHWVGGQLPTAAEWKKAARGTDGRLYPWGDEWDPTRGNFMEEEDAPPLPAGAWGRKTPVDAYPTGVSPYGVYDMVGNLREWTRSLGPFVKREGIIVKAMSVKHARYPYWLCHMVTQEKVWGDWSAEYIGFRPVKDK